MISYNVQFQTYNIFGQVESRCNSITFVNNGSATAVINGLNILSGQSFSISGNTNEIDKTVYNLSFTGGGTQEVIVIRKIYN